jgi:hypothetical protein
MGSVKQWYIYIVSAITLNAVAWAVIYLVRELLIRKLKTPIEVLALMISILVVGLPIYLAHWLWAQRNVTSDPEERESLARLSYLYVMMALFLAPLIISAFGILKALLHLVFSANPTGYGFRPPLQSLTFNLSAAVILALLWFYHQRIRAGDAKILPATDASIIVRHLYIYLFAGAGLIIAALGAGNLIQWITASIAAGPTPVGFGRLYIADVIARLVVGVGVWVVFWLFAQRLFQGSEERERESIIRKIYLYMIILASVLMVVTTSTIVLTDLLERLFDVPSYSPPSGADIRLHMSIILVSGIVWAYHAFVLRQDAIHAGGMLQQSMVRRIYLYLVTGIGLATVLTGIAGEISVFIRAIGGPGLIANLKEQMAVFTAMLIVGIPVWLINWRRVQMAAGDPGEKGREERSALVRRIYLYFYLFIATMAILSSAVFIVWQLVQLALGERVGTSLLVNLGQALGFIVTAGALWLYHGSILRRESRQVKQDIAALLKPLRVVVIDDGDGTLGHAVVEKIIENVPSVTVQPLGLSPAAEAAMNGGGQSGSPAKILADAEVIVGPWHMAIAGSAGGLISDSLARSVITSSALKVLIPVRDEGWEWTGVERWKEDDIVKDVTSTVKQMATQQEVKARHRLSVAAIVVIVLVSLCLLTTVLPMVAGLIFSSIY